MTGVTKMPGSFSRVLLWLFIINLGIALGAGLYEATILVPQWLATSPEGVRHWNAEAARQADTGRRFWVFVSTVPLTLLTLANLAAAWRAPAGVRGWWLGAALAALADRVMTLAYFIPTMVRLMRAADSPASVAAATQWAQLNHLRHAMLLVALLTAMRAFSLSYQYRWGHGGRSE
jgi:hypothetical protein